MVSNKDPAGFTIESFVVLTPVGSIGRGLTREGEINGQALVRNSDSPDGLVSRGCFSLLCPDTSLAVRHHVRFPGEFRDTSNGLVCVIQVPIIGMAKSLMPEPFLSPGFDSRDRD